jgi:hypothetical protein
VDHFSSADLAQIVDDVRRWVVAAASADGSVSSRGGDDRPDGDRDARSAGR